MTKSLKFITFTCLLLLISQFACEKKGETLKEVPVSAPIEIVTDKTASEFNKILAEKSEEIKKALDELNPQDVSILSFGEAETIYKESFKTFVPPKFIYKNFDEEKAENSLTASCRERKLCRDEKIKNLRKEHESALKEENDVIKTQRDAVFTDVINLIKSPPVAAAPCTNLYEVRDRIADDEFPSVILITDGAQTCPNNFAGKPFPKHTKVLILLMPTKDEQANDEYKKRAAFMKGLFPEENVSLIPLASVTSKKIKDFFNYKQAR